jgi:hypothetical protein
LTVTALLNPNNLRFQTPAERNSDTMTVVTGVFDETEIISPESKEPCDSIFGNQTPTAVRNDGIAGGQTMGRATRASKSRD